ncbi:MAG: glycosyltransferase [Bacteroidetes bacterium]|nr:glycosyltransferase [Bacteroidota bacterium]
MNNPKKNILIFSDWYLPSYKAGGPIKSIASLVFYLKNDFNFYILTGNTDLNNKQPHSNIKSNTWHTLEHGERVFYFSDDFFSWNTLKETLRTIPYDVVYLNSFFSKKYTLYPLLLRKTGFIKKNILLAPRGMLGGGALELKHKKKHAFILLSKLVALYNAVCWHATSTQEENEINNVFKKVKTYTIPNLTTLPLEERKNYNKRPQQLSMCCVARISRKKNILFAISCLKHVNQGTVVFDIYGALEDKEYVQQCEELIKTLPKNILVSFKGEIRADKVETVLQSYHAFFLPTLNENFGHAIVEAMLNGCIPIISDTTPWRHLQKKNIGWDIPLNKATIFVEAIEELVQMPQTSFEEKSKKVQQYIRQECANNQHVEAYKTAFMALISQ